MNMQDIRSIFLGIIASLITPFIVSGSTLALALSLNISFEARLLLVNTALILFLIFLQFNIRFSPKQLQLIRQVDSTPIYLVRNNTAQHIPNPETFDYLNQVLGFDGLTIEPMPVDEFGKRFSLGSSLPDIKSYCNQLANKEQDKNS